MPEKRSATSGRAALAAAILVALQGGLLVVAAVVLVVQGLQPTASNRAGDLILAVFVLLTAAACLLLARGIARQLRSTRSPTLVLELICLPVAVTVVQAGRWYAGIPLAVVAVAVLVLVAVAGLLSPDEA